MVASDRGSDFGGGGGVDGGGDSVCELVPELFDEDFAGGAGPGGVCGDGNFGCGGAEGAVYGADFGE